MAVELATAYVQLVPSATGIKGKIEQELNLNSIAQRAGAQAGQTLGRTLVTGATAAFAGLQVGRFFRAAFDQAQEAQKVGAQTAAVLKSTGEAANVSAGQVNDLANALSKKVGIDDEVIQSGENVLLTFRAVRNEAGKGNDIFTRATKAALDLSVVLGTDLKSANLQLGKALNDPVKGMTALTRAGVSFTAQQKATIASLAESGDLLGAQKIILREVTKEFGGSAAAQATAADKARVSIQNLQESVGVALMPAFNTAAKAISFFTDLLNDLPGPIRNIVVDVGLVGAGVLVAAIAVAKFGGAFTLIAQGASAAIEAIQGVTSVLRGFTAAELAATLGTAGIALGFAAIAAGIVFIATAADKLGPGFAQAEASGKRLGQVVGAGAKASAQEITTLEGKIKDLNAGMKVLQAVLDKRTNGSVEIQAEDAAATSAALSLKQLSTERDILNKQLAAAKLAHDQETAAVKASNDAVNVYTTALANGATETEALAAAGDKGREAVQKLNDTLLAAAGGAVGYAQSQQNLIKAQNDYNLAVFLFGEGTPQAVEASLALQQAQLGNVQAAQSADKAQQDLIGSLKGGQSAYDAQIVTLLEQIRLHPENEAAIRKEILALDAAAVAANSIPGAKPIVVSTPGADQAIHMLGLVKLAVDGISDFKTVEVRAVGQLHFASGGSVLAQSVSTVGEHGPELFVPAVDGRILSHADSMRALAAGSSAPGGGGLHIDTAIFGDRDVIPDLDYWTRTKMVGA